MVNFSAMNPEMLAILMEMGSSILSHGLARSEYDYTLNRTSAVSQVKDLKAAGLNPALAYGQISAPQGQALTNHQADFSRAMSNMMKLPFMRKQMESMDADTDVKSANARYNNALASALEYENSHREEVFNKDMQLKDLDIENKGLQNDALKIANAIQTIDFTAKPFILQAQIDNVVASTAKLTEEAKAIKQKLPKELELLGEQIKKVTEEIEHLKSQGMSEEKIRNKLEQETEFLKLQVGFEKFLTANGTNYAVKATYNTAGSLLNALVNLIP